MVSTTGFFIVKKIFEEKFGCLENDTNIYSMIHNETYLTTKEAGLVLKVSRATLNRWRKDKKIKAKKIGGVVRYKLSDIEKALK